MQRLIFWFCLPWLLFLGSAAILYFVRNPHNLILLVPIIALIGFASRAEYAKAQQKSDAMLADAPSHTTARMTENAARSAAASGASPPFNTKGPGQFASFAFRYGLPPLVLGRPAKAWPAQLPFALPAPLPFALPAPPPADDG